MTIPEILEKISLFQDFTPEEIQFIASRCRRRAYQPGDTVFFAGDPGHQVFFIGSGKIKIHLTRDDGEETVYTIVSAGDFFGEMALIDGQPRSADATCTEKSELAFLMRDEFFECIERFPPLSRKVLQVQSQRLRDTDRQLEMMTSLDVYGRVAAQLLELARLHGSETGKGTSIDLLLTQQDLAAMIGASRESVNKVLNSFKSRGFLQMTRGHITLLNLEELRKRT
jgi:CRP/FNR family cyclic AMP-dependent transcriptional regulator